MVLLITALFISMAAIQMMPHKLPSTSVLYGLFLVVIFAAMVPALQNISQLFTTTGFEPHGHCFLWETGILRLYVISDSLTGISYVGISLMLVYLVYIAGRDLPFHRIFLMFGAFIITCGFTHFMDVWTLWNPTYWLSGYARLLTAIASTATAVALPTVLPKVLRLAREARVSQERGHQLVKINADLEHEINERMKVLEALKESEARLYKIIDNAPVIVWSTDAEGNLLTVEGKGRERLNPTAPDPSITSSPKPEAKEPETIFDLFPEAGALKTSLERAKNGHESLTVTQTRDYVFEIRSAPIMQGDVISGITGIAIDITERRNAEIELQKTLEKERELSELKSRFITTISHEFRTPMTIISSSAHLLERYHEQLNFEKQREKLRHIIQETQRMTSMLADFFAIEQMEKAESQLNLRSFDLAKCIQAAIIRSDKLRNENQTITFDASKSSVKIRADEVLLGQAIDSMLNNGLKYSAGGGTVSIDLTCDDSNATMHISDSGIGIPANEIHRIFDAFYRASNAIYIPGTGLGLNIAQQVVEKHGGQISVESTVDVGTSFTIRLPLNTQP